MAKKFHFHGQQAVDEHDQPTEPLPDLNPIASAWGADAPLLPTPLPYEQPFPRQYVPHRPSGDQHVPSSGPEQQQIYAGQPAQEKQKPMRTLKNKQRRGKLFQRTLLLMGVRLVFLGIQLLLVGRFVVKLLFIPVSAGWPAVLESMSAICLLPVHAFLPPLPGAIPANIELYTLLAFLAYHVLSRLLRWLIKWAWPVR